MQTRKRIISWVCVATVVLTAGLAQAQQRRGFFGVSSSTLRVATVSAVGEELKLSDEQTELVKKLNAADEKKRQEIFSGDVRDLSREERLELTRKFTEYRAKQEEQLAKSLGKEKFQRLQQLSVQVGGIVRVVFDRQKARLLEITDDQRTSIRESMSELGQQFRATADDEEARAKLIEKLGEKLTAVLTPDQKKKWKEMQGEPASKELMGKIRTALTRRRVF
jgi:hypothetical protein